MYRAAPRLPMQVYMAPRLYISGPLFLIAGKPTIRPVLKRNVAAVTRPFVLPRVGGRRAAGYIFCLELEESECMYIYKREREGEERERESERDPQNNCSLDEMRGLTRFGAYERPRATQFDVLLWSKWDESTIDACVCRPLAPIDFAACRWLFRSLAPPPPLSPSFSRNRLSWMEEVVFAFLSRRIAFFQWVRKWHLFVTANEDSRHRYVFWNCSEQIGNRTMYLFAKDLYSNMAFKTRIFERERERVCNNIHI